MISKFEISVIIPIYNVSEYIIKAIHSATDIDEVQEVIIIEDGSVDDSFLVCKKIAESNKKVKVFQHPDRLNKGISASRNLGISLATKSYIAFLDADDWYLPHRFAKDKDIFSNIKNVDAVYSCVILESELNRNGKVYGISSPPQKTTSVFDFYKWFIESKKVLFHTNSVTIRKDFLLQGRNFDERLEIHEDTELWIRLIRRGNFLPSVWNDPVAVIRRHSTNNITKRNWRTILKMLEISVSNIGVGIMYDFELEYFYSGIIRAKSKKFKNNLKRRFYFYVIYYLYFFNKMGYLRKNELN